MQSLKQALCLTLLSAIASLGYAGSAQAFSFRMTRGIAAPDGSLDQGAFSEFTGKKGVTTINFNDGTAPTTGPVQFSFENGISTSSGQTGIYNDVWAPAGPDGERNQSNYLAVFQGNKVTIDTTREMNYFGINWGAISPGNEFSFYNGDQLVKSFTTADVNPIAPVKVSHQNDEGSGFIHFYADTANETFNKIVVSQTGGGGFESDNYSFNEGTDGFDFEDKLEEGESTPEPGVMLGLVVVGGVFLLKQNSQKMSQA